jgi:phage baseplate assembly protein W
VNQQWTTGGFRFLHPDIDAPGSQAGFQITAAGSVATVRGDEAVRQALLLLLSTVPGERVMRPEYGCELHRLIFAPNDDTTAGLAIHYVRRAIQRNEPRVDIVRLDARRSPVQDERLDIALVYRVRATGREDLLQVSVDLQGGA